MFDLLWHLRGSIRLDGRLPDIEVLNRVEQMLEKQRKPTIERGSSSIFFEEPLWSNFWGPNWRATVIYDQGRLWIDQYEGQRSLRYDFRSLHAFVFCAVAATTFFVFGLLAGDLVQGLTIAALAFGWVYGMNLILALTRVPLLIRRTVRVN
jgi:hypothetical protein